MKSVVFEQTNASGGSSEGGSGDGVVQQASVISGSSHNTVTTSRSIELGVLGYDCDANNRL